MQISKNYSKNIQFGILKHPSQPILQAKAYLHKKMAKQYSTSQGYFYSKIIEDLIEKKQSDKNCIKVNDVKFDDWKQYMEKYYKRNQSHQQFPQLLQYYKYYAQDSICFLNTQFAFLSGHHDKKKAILYQQLKKQLNISDSQHTIEQVTRFKSNQKFDNILSGLQLSYFNDQSYLVAQVLKKLVHRFGPSRIKTINKIDSQFKFMTHNLAMSKVKNHNKDGPSLFNPQTMLESTNTSVRNNCYLKHKNNSNTKNMTHRRFVSCEVPKSPATKSVNFTNNKQIKKINKGRRRKSAQLLSSTDLNTVMSQQLYKKNIVKTQEHNKLQKTNITQTNFRDKMQQLRRKIRKQKQNLYKKPQTGCINKKKSKK